MSGRALFRWSAAGALVFHALLLLRTHGVEGGGDLVPHLRLVQRMAEDPALRSVYPPFYHALGALAAPWVGLAAYPEWFAWASAAALIAGFRSLQRAAGLPDAAAAIFAWAPYGFALTRCLPKIEAAGYALAFLGLALVFRRRYVALAATLAATFWVHTAAALFLGLAGGVLALARREPRALAALAVGTLGAVPLVAAHLAAGCSLPEAVLFSRGDYLRAAPRLANLAQWDRLLVLANPIALVAAVAGASRLWREHRTVAVLCVLITVLCLNELWLAPFGARTTLDLLRGLTLLAVPVAIGAAIHLEERHSGAVALVGASAVLAVLASGWVVPDVCVSKPVDVGGVARFEVDRCTFRWRVAHPAPRASRGARAEPSQVLADRRVQRPPDLESAPQ